MTSSAKTPSRRNLVKGAAWAAPAVVATSAVPAYAASRCPAASIFSQGVVTYSWGVAPYTGPHPVNPTGTTTQTFTAFGVVGGNLPAGAVITKIEYEYWVQQRDDSFRNSNGTTGSRGPGVYDPGNTRSNISRTCRINWANVTSCSYPYAVAGSPVRRTTYGSLSTSPIFSSRAATVAVTHSWTDHAFSKLDGSTETQKGWRLLFTGDAAVANAQLIKDASGCLTLPDQLTSTFEVVYSNVATPANFARTVLIDRKSYITYRMPDGSEHTLVGSRRNDLTCDSSGSHSGVNRC